MRGAERSCRARGSYSHVYKSFLVSGRARARMRECKGPSDAVQLALEDVLARVHDSLERNPFGHKWWPGWTPEPETNVEKLPPEPRRHRRGGHGLGVFQYTCESLRAPDRLHELMALATRMERILHAFMVRFLMGLVSGPNTGTTSSHSTAADRVKKDGCMIAVSTKFLRTQVQGDSEHGCQWRSGHNTSLDCKCK